MEKYQLGGFCESTVASDFEAEIVELYERHVESIYCFCFCRLFAKDLAEEATSEVFLKLVEKYPSLRKEGLKKKTELNARKWLFGTARNTIAKQIRKAKQQQETVKGIAYIKDMFATPQTNPEKHIELEEFYKAIGKLNDRDQEIVVHRFKGATTSQIAEWMGMAHGTVRVRLSRAIRTLRKILRTRHA